MKTSPKTLIYLSAAVWMTGGVMLFISGYELVQDAARLRPGEVWPWVFSGGGVLLGIIQAGTIFTRACRKNIQRIRQLQDPRLWQFFRPGFFGALALMISSGILLDHFSQGNYYFMLGVAGIDFALTVSLLGSSHVFWTGKRQD